MTPTGELAELAGLVDHLLVDFDIPVCRLFAGLPAPVAVASRR